LKENDNPKTRTKNGGKGKRKGANRNDGERRNLKRKRAKRITNDNQVEEFKVTKGETWEGIFRGKCPKKQVKWMVTFMRPCYHMKRECWDKSCKYSKMHKPVYMVPQEEKNEYLKYMECCRRKSSASK
jgi:hypothetical protein